LSTDSFVVIGKVSFKKTVFDGEKSATTLLIIIGKLTEKNAIV